MRPVIQLCVCLCVCLCVYVIEALCSAKLSLDPRVNNSRLHVMWTPDS